MIRRTLTIILLTGAGILSGTGTGFSQNLDALKGDDQATAQPAAPQGTTTAPGAFAPANPAAPNAGLPPAAAAAQAATQAGTTPAMPVVPLSNSHYTLGPTDIIEITVQRHPEVSGNFIINNEGKIQYQFVGDVAIAGLTKDEVTDVLKKSLATYIVNPDVTVRIVGYNSKIVYIVGEVGRPGKVFMRGDTITIREALIEAGLPMLSGNTKKATMFTPSDTGKVAKKNVNVYALLYEGDLRQDYVMKPGDALYIPPTLWANIGRAINPVAQPIGAAAGTGRTLTGFGF